MHALLFALLALFALSIAGATPTPATKLPALVKLRIEGDVDTLFEAPVLTQGHDVTTATGGTHHCDGTNLGANPTPGPTCTSALDTGSLHQHRFVWDGSFDTGFDDFFITSIAGVAETATQFWGILLNFQLIPVGGCQQQVTNGQEVLFAFDAFNKSFFLKASGPPVAKVGKAVVVTVIDGTSGVAIEGASIGGELTDANGHASITFSSKGLKKLKATRSDSIRSNAVEILVA
ncbi:hypothetical protein SISSUDRAFT_1035782 [Sistotremastrum suecicum HHB10207 ss-3]|uniref:Transcobalamin-like C-terminal domain-containing protein n=1 Tax=Sistotremastrum suecicum HHB10207 ss-3 TaxID=1314776 RepID=A0A166AA37_9AGAM|nr:hypothetical protein SISSUDRAFT_1035782 [Sistotremastrum suecicum HHB10207 ss-3]